MITDKQINEMVNRFLNWKLPKDFHPDGGVTFQRTYNGYRDGKFTVLERTHEDPFWPVGTNLLTADQAKEMIKHMIEGCDK